MTPPSRVCPQAFYADASKQAPALLCALALTAGGVWLGAIGASWIGWVGAAFFGACAAVIVRELARPGPRLSLSDDGLYDRTLGVGVIAWTDILDAWPVATAGVPFVGLDLRAPDLYLDRLSPARRLAARLNRAAGHAPLSVNLWGLRDADPARVALCIQAWASASPSLPGPLS